MIWLLHSLQLIAGLTWAGVLVSLTPNAWRLVVGGATETDWRAGPMVLIAFIGVNGTLHWLLFPNNDSYWAAIWVLWIIAALWWARLRWILRK